MKGRFMPGCDKLPSTLKRSPAKARAHRTTFAALKHSVEKKGARRVPKGHKRASDPRSTSGRSRSAFGGRSSMSKRNTARAIARKQ
jgi:hypothetical protein